MSSQNSIDQKVTQWHYWVSGLVNTWIVGRTACPEGMEALCPFSHNLPWVSLPCGCSWAAETPPLSSMEEISYMSWKILKISQPEEKHSMFIVESPHVKHEAEDVLLHWGTADGPVPLQRKMAFVFVLWIICRFELGRSYYPCLVWIKY